MSLLLTRRQTLQTLATGAVFASGLGGALFGLAGCGGGGVGGGPKGGSATLRLTPITAQITLPGGSSPAVASLKVGTSGGSETPDATGKVRVTVFDNGPQYTEARDASGRLVLAGFLGKGRTALDAASTAEALGFLALGGTVVTGKARRSFFDGVRGVAGFDAAVSAVEAELKAEGFVTTGDAGVAAALEAMYAAAGGGAAPSASSRGVTADPTSASGLALDTITDGQVTIENVYLRRVLAWFEPIEHTVETNGGRSTVPATHANPAAPFEIPVPKRYGGLTATIADVIQGNIPYSPVKSDPLKTPAAYPGVPNCVETKYRLTTAGLGLGAGAFGDLGLRQDPAKAFYVKSFLLDYLLPLVTTVILPVNGDKFDDLVGFANANGAFADLLNTTFATLPSLWEACAKGDWRDVLFQLRDAGLLSGTYFPAMVNTILEWAKGSSDPNVLAKLRDYAPGGVNILDLFGRFDRAIAAAEYVVIGHDLKNSNLADIFTILSREGKVTLSPEGAAAAVDGKTTLTAIVQDKNADAVYRYEWSVDKGEFLLTAPDGKNTFTAPGGVLVSNFDKVEVSAPAKAPGDIVVSCTVTRIDGEPDVRIGTATAKVTFGNTFVQGIPMAGLFYDKGNGVYSIWSELYVDVPNNLPNSVAYELIAFPEAYRSRIEELRSGTQFGPGQRIGNPNIARADHFDEAIPDGVCRVRIFYAHLYGYGNTQEEALADYIKRSGTDFDQLFADFKASAPWTWQVTLSRN